MSEAARAAIDGARRDGTRLHPDRESFARSPSGSIDHDVLEKADRGAVVAVEIGGSGVGRRARRVAGAADGGQPKLGPLAP